MTEVETKKCSKCSKVKSIDDFYKSQCLRCYNYQKKYYEDNREKVNARIKECKERRPEHYKEKQREREKPRVFCEYCQWDVLKYTWNKHCKSQNHLLNIKMIEEGLDESYYRKARDEIFRGVWKGKMKESEE